MADVLYAFTDADLDLLKRLFQDYVGGRLTFNPPTGTARNPAIETYIAQANEDIDAISQDDDGNATPGSGEATIYGLNTDEYLEEQTDFTVTVYNLWSTPINEDDWIVIVRDPFSGAWFAVQGGNGMVEIAVGSGPDGSGYYSGTADGNAVKVKNSNGYPLASGYNVLGTPNGLDGSTPAYLTDMGGFTGTTSRTWVTQVVCAGGTLTVTYSTETITYVNGAVITTTVS